VGLKLEGSDGEALPPHRMAPIHSGDRPIGQVTSGVW
jgi:hypothetical protein